MDRIPEADDIDPEQAIKEIGTHTAYYLTCAPAGEWTPCSREIEAASAQQALDFLQLQLRDEGVPLDFEHFRYVCMVADSNIADERHSTQPSPDGFTAYFAYSGSGNGRAEHRWSVRLGPEDNVSCGQQATNYVKQYPGSLLAVVLAHDVVVEDYLERDPTWCTFDGEPPKPESAPAATKHHAWGRLRHW